ncbi:MAG: efflux RND transporter permease subunit [Pseudomonadales bacterium]
MRQIVAFFIERHLLVNIMAFAMVGLGLLATTNLKREYLPSFETPIIWLTARLPGASAQDIETKIAIPIQEALEEVEGIDDYYTVVSDNTSFTTVELYEDFESPELIEAEKEIRDAIDAITDFPPEMDEEPGIKRLNPAREIVIELAIQGSMQELVGIAETLEERIEAQDTISKVDIVGLQDPEVRILVDPVKAIAHDVSLDSIVAAIDKRNVSSTGGFIENAEEQRQVVMWSRFDRPEEVADTILKTSATGGVLRIRDIARVEAAREDGNLIVRNNGERGLTLAVRKRAQADIIDATDDVKAVVENADILEGVDYLLVNDESYIVSNRLILIANNGLMGIVLVAVVLIYFVRLQPAIWIMLGIPIVFLGSLALFGQTGMSLNMMSLGGFVIVLGMVVDDAVVVSERIAFKQAQGVDSKSAAIEGTLEMMPAVVAASLTTILAFSPMLAIGGIPGKISWQIPAVVVLALLVSVFESFFVLPAHMSSVKAGSQLEKRKLLKALEHRYEIVLSWALQHRLIIILTSVTLFLVIMIVIRPLIPFTLFPQDDADRLYVKLSAPMGTPLEQTEAMVAGIERQIMSITEDDLELVSSRIGHQNDKQADKNRGEASNEALMILQFEQTDRRYTNAEWIQVIHKNLKLPESIRAVYLSEYFGPPTDQPVTLHVLSNEDSMRRGVAMEVANYLRNIPGVIEIDIDERPGTPQIDLELDYEKLALRGLDAATVGRALSIAFYGVEASEHRTLDDVTKLRVQFDAAGRADVSGILDVPVRSSDGRNIPLRDVVTAVERPALTRIYHRNGYRSSTLRASFTPESGLTALPFAERMEKEVLARYRDIPGLILEIDGEAVSTQDTADSMSKAALIAVSGIALVVWLMLGSIIEALFILIVIPFAVAGVIFTFFVHGMTLSMFAILGSIGLAGVVVNGAIVMVDAVHRRLNAKNVQRGDDEEDAIIIETVVERLRPILVTTLTTLGGVLPTAYGLGGYDPMLSPMSMAIGWGLVFSTFVTLFVVPVLYSFARDVNHKLSSFSPALRVGQKH